MSDAASTTADLLPPEPRADLRVRLLRATCAGLAILFLAVLVPVLNKAGVVADRDVVRLGRYLCFAIAAVGVDLVWGYSGVLTLCNALFFCLGGYAMAMYLSLPAGGGDVRPEYNDIPQFFFFNNVTDLPAFWRPFASFPVAVGAGVLLTGLLAFAFGYLIFRSRVKGVYFSILTQAVAWGAFLAFSRNELLLGGTNGLTNFSKKLTREVDGQSYLLWLYLLTCGVLATVYAVCWLVTRSRLGRLLVAVRDNESRLYFAGYRPYMFKAFSFALGAAIAAIGGMLYAPQTGIITPNIMRVTDSIDYVIWVAFGGRGRLWGAVVGALSVNYAYSVMTSDMPAAWPFVQGAMFIAVVVAFPEGVVGLWDKLEARLAGRESVVRVAVLAVPMAAAVLALMAEMTGLMPAWLNADLLDMGRLGEIKMKYAVLLGVIVAGIAGEKLLNLRPPRRDDRDDEPAALAVGEARA